MVNFLKGVYSIWVMLLFVLIILFFFPFVLFVLILPIPNKLNAMLFLIKGMSIIWFLLTGVRTKVYNKPTFDLTQSTVIIANHNSYLDAPTAVLSIPFNFRTLGKMEIAKIPIFGLVYKSVVILIDRTSAITRAKSYLKMVDTIKNGDSVLLFPEGTFDEDNNKFKPFQDGAFKLAIDAQAQILPFLMLDTYKRMMPNSIFKFSPGINRVVWLPAISVKGLEKNQDKSLKFFVQNYMQDCMNFAQNNPQAEVQEYAMKWLNQNEFVNNNLS
jgi:1-acyl-sn-glycerol-3-phosphate acyltransferase